MSRTASPEEYQGETPMLVLSYLSFCCLILPLIPFFTAKDKPYVRHHAANGVALLIAAIGLMVPLRDAPAWARSPTPRLGFQW